MRDGRMLSICASPNRNRNTQARPPVTKLSGRPAINRMASEPNISTVSHRMSISSPTVRLRWQMTQAAIGGDVVEQADDALQQQ